jgi:excisionase family DNA binding protein
MQGNTSDMDSGYARVTQSVQQVSGENGADQVASRLDRRGLLTTAEASDILRVTQQTVRNWLKAGVLKGYVKSGDKRSLVRITAESVQNVLDGKAW